MTLHAVDLSTSGEVYGFGVHRELFPEWTGNLDLRPQFEATQGERLKFLTRPRLKASTQTTKFQFDDLYLNYFATETLTLTAGIQNYQWGPAELLSPSNPLFHLQQGSRSLLFRQRGLVLLKTIYSISPDLIVTGLAEPVSYMERDWIAGKDYAPRGLIKIERRFKNAGNYLALVGGRMDDKTAFVGQYGSWYPTEVFSLYFDARETETNILATLGVRYEGDIDTRAEYVYNGFGYDETQWRLALLTGAFLQPSGLELPKRHYLYLSLRTDKLGKGDSLRVSLRYLASLQDGSGTIITPIEWSFADSFTAILEPSFSHGGKTSELHLGSSYEILGAVRFAY